MQRLSSWFEHLSLRHRGSSRRSKNCCSGLYLHKRQSKSVTSRSLAGQNYNHRDNSVDTLSQSLIINDQLHVIMPSSWNRQETVIYSCRDSSKLNASILQPFSAPTGSGRKNIRTNPWISHSHPMIQSITYQLPESANELVYASVDHTASFRIKNLDESIYSSGYGSQDSSPESSVHSPDWQPSVTHGQCGRLQDKAVECNLTGVDEALGLNLQDKSEIENLKTTDAGDRFRKADENVYHELEAFSKLSLLLDSRTCSYDSEIASSSDGSVHSSRCLSPVYVQPNQDYYRPHYCCHQSEEYGEDEVTEYPNVASSFTYIPCIKNRPLLEFHSPSPPSLSSSLSSMRTKDLEQAEMDFLTDLDAQIADLQLRSVEVCQLVDEARVHRDARIRNAQLSQELAELRRMKWVLHSHFELEL